MKEKTRQKSLLRNCFNQQKESICTTQKHVILGAGSCSCNTSHFAGLCTSHRDCVITKIQPYFACTLHQQRRDDILSFFPPLPVHSARWCDAMCVVTFSSKMHCANFPPIRVEIYVERKISRLYEMNHIILHAHVAIELLSLLLLFLGFFVFHQRRPLSTNQIGNNNNNNRNNE